MELDLCRLCLLFWVMIEFPELGGIDSRVELVPRCSTSRNRMYSLLIGVAKFFSYVDITVTEANKGKWMDIIYKNMGMRIQIRQHPTVGNRNMKSTFISFFPYFILASIV